MTDHPDDLTALIAELRDVIRRSPYADFVPAQRKVLLEQAADALSRLAAERNRSELIAQSLHPIVQPIVGGPIPLDAEQEQAVKAWAADDRLWTTQETVEINLRTFARTILKPLYVAAERMGWGGMSIDANVVYVELKEDGSGVLHLCDRVPEGPRGQSRLHFSSAPYEVTALNGLSIWGGPSQIMLGDYEIAKRDSYTRISFTERDRFLAAVAAYHATRRRQPTEEPG